MLKGEAKLHQDCADYLKLQYRGVIYRTDFAAGIKMTQGQAIRHKRLQHGRAYPDLFIAHPVGSFHGGYIELKKEGERMIKRDGTYASDHIAEQAEVLAKLRSLGYFAEFAVGWDEAKQTIDDYLRGRGGQYANNHRYIATAAVGDSSIF